MDDLNPKARALVVAGRGALRATTGDRERIEAALRAQLGASALPDGADLARVARSAGWRAGARLAVGVAVVVGAAIVALRPAADAPAPARSAQTPPTQLPPRATGQQADAEADATSPTAGEDATTKLALPSAQPATPSGRRDRLAQEVALLSRATAQLQAGHAAQALRALAEHQRKFPNGALREERRAAKAQALCLSGNVPRGRAELALLPAQSPGAARAEQVCDAGSLSTVPQP